MKIEQTQENGICVVSLKGQYDALAAPAAESALLALAHSVETPVVLDLSELEYIGSLGLHTILKLSEILRQRGIALRLCGFKPFVRQVFEISRFARLFEILPTRDEALAAFAGDPMSL